MAGDGTFAPSDSTGVPITVNKENSRLQVGIVTFDIVTGNITSTNATSVAYGSPYILRMDILNSTNSACQPLATGGSNNGLRLRCDRYGDFYGLCQRDAARHGGRNLYDQQRGTRRESAYPAYWRNACVVRDLFG